MLTHLLFRQIAESLKPFDPAALPNPEDVDAAFTTGDRIFIHYRWGWEVLTANFAPDPSPEVYEYTPAMYVPPKHLASWFRTLAEHRSDAYHSGWKDGSERGSARPIGIVRVGGGYVDLTPGTLRLALPRFGQITGEAGTYELREDLASEAEAEGGFAVYILEENTHELRMGRVDDPAAFVRAGEFAGVIQRVGD